ncbi:MAG: response regulator transcription factor [Chloroflexi bacterium]|nr:response regulator transcription factor [Chloroflexota bacterium]
MTMRAKPRILIVDDEVAITSNLSPLLERAGFDVIIAVDGNQGLRLVQEQTPDLIVLDVLMPRLNGREMLRTLRHQGNWTPVILLTQVGDSSERTMALWEGADDYLNKPFDPYELIARIQAVLRRVRPGTPPLSSARRIGDGRLVLDRTARRVWLNSQELSLTPKAIAILEYLMTHADELISRERLLNTVWGWDYSIGGRVIDTRIAELRKALQDDPAEPRYIVTIPGEGYRYIGAVNPIP